MNLPPKLYPRDARLLAEPTLELVERVLGERNKNARALRAVEELPAP
jgi:hypothetical protein